MSSGVGAGDDEQHSLEARRHFREGNYDEALSELNVLKRSNDTAEVSHNIALVSYYKEDKQFPDRLVDELEAIRTKSPDDDDPIEMATLVYNAAVVLYQQERYALAMKLLEDLYSNIEPLREELILRICFLLLDSYSALVNQTQYVDKAAVILSFLIKEEPVLAVAAVDCGMVSSEAEFKPMLHLYEAKIDMLAGNIKASKKALKRALDLTDEESAKASPVMVFLSAQLAYVHADYPKSLRILNTWNKKYTNTEAPIPYFNNLGCIHYQLNRYHTASFYLSKALQETVGQCEEGESKGLPAFAKDKSGEVLYNMGLQLLLAGKPDLAFACYKEAAALYFQNALLWVRTAECCIRLFQEPLAGNNLIKGVVGSGRTRRVLLPSTPPSEPPLSEEEDGEQATPSLEYAAGCLRRALLLKPNATLTIECQVKLAYVSLAIGDTVAALAAARAVLAQKPSPNHAYLAHMYAAEALCALNRPEEAMEHLSPSVLEAIPATEGGEARLAALLVNLATIHIHQGSFGEAEAHMSEALGLCPGHVPALLLKVYIELRKGNVSIALDTLKKRGSNMTLLTGENRPIMDLPGNPSSTT